MPKISIIVPVYNTEKYLCSCIDSILNQTFTDFELLLVDDGSTDNSGKVCDEYALKDARIRVFHIENGGVSYARNLGIENAKGEWISFVDSDDILYLDAISVLYENSKDVKIVTATIETNNKVWKQSCIGLLSSQEYVEGLCKGSVFGYLVATLYHYSLFNNSRVLIPKNLKIGEDVLFKLDIARSVGKARNIDDVIYWYRTNPTSAMQSYQRSIRYYVRYFKFRDQLISDNLKFSLKQNDLSILLDAFYNPHIPYREQDYLFMRNKFQSQNIENIEFSSIEIKRIRNLKNKSKLMLYKYFHYYKFSIVNFVLKRQKFIILD